MLPYAARIFFNRSISLIILSSYNQKELRPIRLFKHRVVNFNTGLAIYQNDTPAAAPTCSPWSKSVRVYYTDSGSRADIYCWSQLRALGYSVRLYVVLKRSFVISRHLAQQSPC